MSLESEEDLTDAQADNLSARLKDRMYQLMVDPPVALLEKLTDNQRVAIVGAFFQQGDGESKTSRKSSRASNDSMEGTPATG